MRNYETAVASGFYERDLRGMEGKYDNVRRYWEDQISRYALRPFVEPMVRRKRRELSRIRVVDLGAGAGEGYEILTGMKTESEDLPSQEVVLLPAELIGHYHGLDISDAMVVREAIATIRNVVRSVQWFRMGDPRANVVEPQLGYILRNLEMDLQQGLGAGHGLLAIYELRKE